MTISWYFNLRSAKPRVVFGAAEEENNYIRYSPRLRYYPRFSNVHALDLTIARPKAWKGKKRKKV